MYTPSKLEAIALSIGYDLDIEIDESFGFTHVAHAFGAKEYGYFEYIVHELAHYELAGVLTEDIGEAPAAFWEIQKDRRNLAKDIDEIRTQAIVMRVFEIVTGKEVFGRPLGVAFLRMMSELNMTPAGREAIRPVLTKFPTRERHQIAVDRIMSVIRKHKRNL
jgi:hypothetical protein